MFFFLPSNTTKSLSVALSGGHSTIRQLFVRHPTDQPSAQLLLVTRHHCIQMGLHRMSSLICLPLANRSKDSSMLIGSDKQRTRSTADGYCCGPMLQTYHHGNCRDQERVASSFCNDLMEGDIALVELLFLI